MLINFEDLKEDYENTICKIEKEYSLVRKNLEILKVEKFKGISKRDSNKFKIKNQVWSPEFIIENSIDLDLSQEEKLGYLYV